MLALDAKVSFDDNALYRHPDLRELRDLGEEDPLEVEASKFSLNYIKLDGNIGCMVNGAGLAMTSMDIVKLFGGEPANFLDIGGGAGAEKVAAAMRIILSDPNVKAVLFNIFGGITRGDEVAKRIRETNAPKDIPIVLMTAFILTDQEMRLMKSESGVDHIINNPLPDVMKLKQILDDVISNKKK